MIDLELRRKSIGGNDVAAILGLNPYKTALDVYHEKVNGYQQPDNPKMKAGRLLENAVAIYYKEETGRKIQKSNQVITHKNIPYLAGNIDRIILPKNGEGRGVLEIKTASTYSSHRWNDNPPIEYMLQLHHYLDVTGYNWGEIAVLIGGNDFHIYEIGRDEEIISLKNEKLTKFVV